MKESTPKANPDFTHIVIVEDEPGINVLLQSKLEGLGYNIAGFYTADEAIDFLRKEKDVILLLDYQLNDGTAKELIMELKNEKITPPFIIMTGHGDEKIAVELMKLGALDYIIKEADFYEKIPSVLLKAINNQILRNKLKKSQEELRISEEKFRILFEILPVGVSITNKNGDIIEVNPKSEEILQVNRGDHLQRTISDKSWRILDHQGKPLGQAHYASVRALKDGVTVKNQEMGILTNTDTVKWINVNATPINHKDYGIAITYADITEKKESENALIESENRYRLITENTNDLIFNLTNDGYFKYVNSAFFRLLGYHQDDLTGKPIYSIIDDQHQQEFKTFLTEIANGKNQEPYLIEHKLKSQNGKSIWFETNIKILNEKESMGGFLYIGIGRDITEARKSERLKKAKEMAEFANKAKSEFLANISHEIRNPMNVIVGMSNMLNKTNLNENQKKYLHSIIISTDNLLNLINDVLDISKIEANKTEISLQVFNLRSLIYEIIIQYKEQIEEKGLDFKYYIDKEIPERVVGDSGKLRQIITNLLSNSVKFTSKGTIEFSSRKKSHNEKDVELVFVVKDSGRGIKEDDFDKIFEAFKQLDSSTTKEISGTGLGLAIVKSFTELLNGSIDFTSTYGKGSSFTITIPFSLDDEKNKAIPSLLQKNTIEPSDSFKPLKILLVEDDGINRFYLQSFLEEAGWDVVTAKNGLEAIDIYSKKKFDLILMDGQMPKMDGMQATKKIRALEADNKHIPIVAITGYAIENDEERFLQAGMDAYITKPINERKLIQMIQHLTRKNY